MLLFLIKNWNSHFLNYFITQLCTIHRELEICLTNFTSTRANSIQGESALPLEQLSISFLISCLENPKCFLKVGLNQTFIWSKEHTINSININSCLHQVLSPGVDFSYDCRLAKVIEIALSEKNIFAVRCLPNYCATKRCEKIRRMANSLNLTYEKSTPGLNRQLNNVYLSGNFLWPKFLGLD